MEEQGQSDNNNNTAVTTAATSHCRELFGDCALIEMIHLHDCFRGAIRTLQEDVRALAAVDENDQHKLKWTEKKVTGRFQVIWSVFQAHSTAEDEFIWPALLSKLEQQDSNESGAATADDDDDNGSKSMHHCCSTTNPNSWREYEKDHVVLERMFSETDHSLAQLREYLGKTEAFAGKNKESQSSKESNVATKNLIKAIQEHTKVLSRHLLDHLEKEETHCMPFIAKRLTKAEIQDLVGCIMGKRSADTVTKIMTMATQSLDEEERLDMLRYMKEAMEGTFFDRWLHMSGWMPSSTRADADAGGDTTNAVATKRDSSEELEAADKKGQKRLKTQENKKLVSSSADKGSPKELQRFIRAIATNPGLTAAQKNMTIRGLEDSVRISCLRNKQQFS